MIEFLIGNYIVDRKNHKRKIKEGFVDSLDPMPFFDFNDQGAVAALVVSLVIAFITAYIAFQCNSYANAGVRFITTLFAFFFSGIYLIYFFIVYIIFDDTCNGTKDIFKMTKNIETTIRKKKRKPRRKRS